MTNLFSGIFIEGHNPVQIPSLGAGIKRWGAGVNLAALSPVCGTLPLRRVEIRATFCSNRRNCHDHPPRPD